MGTDSSPHVPVHLRRDFSNSLPLGIEADSAAALGSGSRSSGEASPMLPIVYGSGNTSGSSSVRGSRQSSVDSDFAALSMNEGGGSSSLVQNRLTTGSPTTSPASAASPLAVNISPTPVVNVQAASRVTCTSTQPIVSGAMPRAVGAVVSAPHPAQAMPRVQSHQSSSGGHPGATVTTAAPRYSPIVVAAAVNPNVGGSSSVLAGPLRLKLSGADLCWTCKVNPVKVGRALLLVSF